jgi:D-xylose reductase
MSNSIITTIAQKHNKSMCRRFRSWYRLTVPSLVAAAQVLLRWATQRGIAVVPKSNSSQRNIENMRCDSFNLEEEDLKVISALNKHLRV